jgi:hypothetical protein
VSSAAGTYFEAPLTLEGTNNATGPGFMNMMSAPLAFAAGAKMNAERIAFRGTSSASGGELQVSKAANFSAADRPDLTYRCHPGPSACWFD